MKQLADRVGRCGLINRYGDFPLRASTDALFFDTYRKSCIIVLRKEKSMTDSSKWKSVMVTKDTHDKIRDLSSLHKLSINQVLTYLVDKAWDSGFVTPVKAVPANPTTFRSKA